MRLHSITLHNIRSYEDATLNFPEGSLLLSGDIGCGKTTILLAVEFALFGLLKGEVDGTTLLRHGAKTGWVELEFEVSEKRVRIRRGLKRASSVTQEAGSLTVNGVEEKRTPVELKSAVLDLLGYPADLLTKSKSLIYRFTVYTPQEEMKKILFEAEDERLDTLRKIFDLDKYKRVKDNLLQYAKQLNLRAAIFEGRLEDLPQREAQAKEHRARLDALAAQIKAATQDHRAAAAAARMATEAAMAAEGAANAVRASTNERALKEQQAGQLEQQQALAARDIGALFAEIVELAKNVAVVKARAEFETLLAEADAALKARRAELDEIKAKAAAAAQKRAEIQALLSAIGALSLCPTCRQGVSDGHKAAMRDQERGKLEKLATLLEKAAAMQKERATKVEALEARRQELFRELSEAARVEAVRLHMADKQARLDRLKKGLADGQAALAALRAHMAALPDPAKMLAEKTAALAKARAGADEALQREHTLAVQLARLSQEEDTLRGIQKSLEEDIAEKRMAALELDRLREARHWLLSYLVPCVEVIEKRVLRQVYHQFNQYFCEWFTLLMGEETITARLGEDFAPVIEQNGYETFLGNLSGGERTAVALAYRLALNKVINDFVVGIHTRELLILDEPTDGFSAEQLDRVKEVLDQLSCRQVVLVSHEPKMEAYVQTIMRVAKEGHVSRILN